MIIFLLILVKAQFDCFLQIEQCDPLNCIVSNCEYKPQFITLTIEILTFQNVFIQLPIEDPDQIGNFKIQAKNLTIQDSQIEKLLTFNGNKSSDFIIIAEHVLFDHVISITSERIVINGNQIFINQSNFNCSYFHMIGSNIVVQSSKFDSKLRKCKGNCNCEVGLCDLSEVEKYSEYTDFQSNFTFSIESNKLQIINSTMRHAGIGIKGNISLNQYTLLSASGLGCEAQQGFGCGFNDWVVSQKLKCGSSGGSYGEIGKSPRSEVNSFSFICDQLLPRQPYGDMFFPVFEGSGGGGKYFGGSGGGIIFIVGKYLKLEGRIEADGLPPVRQEDLTYGGGSGGSILIYGSIDGEAKLSCKGGILAKRLTQISGDGGGGRIAIWNNDFFHSLTIEQGFGTLYQTPCLQMYQLKDFKCVPCEPGYYNMMIDNNICRLCINYNPHSVFYDVQKTPFCQVKSCIDNYVLNDNDCITYSENVVRTLGGENLIFGIVVFCTLLIINVIIIAFIIRVQSNQVSTSNATFVSDFDSNDEQNKDQASSIPHFVVEDLPYFVKRIYLQGSNTLEYPWEMAQNPELLEYAQFIDQINETAQYNNLEKIILGLFYYFYYPFYHFLLQYLQKRKYVKISQKFLKTKAQTAQDIRIGFFAKISSSSDHTLAHIDIMNYNNNILDWSNKTTFPVTLILNGYGTFLFPWQINSRDPLIKSLQLSFQKFKLFDQSIQASYLDEAEEESSEEEITSFEEFINKFNKLCVRIDIRQSQTEFLKHSIEVLEFIDDANKEIFLRKKILVDICFHILGENQSSLIMLSTRHMREIQQTLKEIHSLFNFNPEYQIKLSINFDKIKLLPRYFDNQIIVRTAKDINEQITMYQKYEEDKEELNNLKLQMQRRMEAEGLLSPLLEEQTYIISNVKGKQNNKRTLSKLILQTQRALALTSSFYVRYRTKRFNDKILTLLLIFLFFISLFIDMAYVFLSVTQFNTKNDLGVLMTEFIFQLIVFPLSWMLSPAFLLYWMFKPHNENGKRFLLINFSCLFNTVFILLFGFIELAQSLIQNGNNKIAIFCLLKPAVFINYNIVAYIGSFYLNK